MVFNRCAVFKCATGAGVRSKITSKHGFPSSVNTCQQWLRACGNPALLSIPHASLVKNYVVCGLHFKDTDKKLTHRGTALKNKLVVPTLNVPGMPEEEQFSNLCTKMDQDLSSKIDDATKLLYCRTCGQMKKDTIPIFSDEGKDRQLADKINNCLPIFVFMEDWLPLQVCLRCVLWLETTQQLRTSCLSADEELRKIFTEPIDDLKPQLPTPLQYSIDEFLNISNQTTRTDELRVNPKTAPLTESSNNVVVSDSLQFLAAELGVKDARTLLIVENTSSECDVLPIRMPTQKDIIPPPLICNYCKYKPKNSRGFRSHMQIVHKKKVYPCTLCYVYFSKPYSLREHFELIHPQLRVPSTEYSTYKTAENKKVIKRKKCNTIRIYKERKCSKCGEVFPYEALDDFKKHMKIHRDAQREEIMKTASVKCDYCIKMFLTDKSKIFHMKMSHKEYKPYECEICSKRFHNKQCSEEHRLSHEAARPFLCSICGKSFAGKMLLHTHMQSHIHWTCNICNMTIGILRKKKHLLTHIDKRIYQCMECGESFFDRVSLKEHASSHFETIHQCGLCGFCFGSELGLHAHLEYHKDDYTRRYKCPVKQCYRQFISVSDATRHVSLHTKDEQFNIVRVYDQANRVRSLHCYSCEQSFRHMGKYLDHMSSHQCDPLAPVILHCALCKFRARGEAEMTSHLESHPQAFTFPCRHCIEKFVTDKQREVHEGVAHGGKVQCSLCFAVLRNKVVLASHINAAHTGERPHVCNICNRGFYDRQVLKKHASIHSGIRKFSCNLCSKTFRLKPDLSKHYLLHTNEKKYKCSECSYSGNRRKDINLHIAAEHADLCDEDSD